MVILPSTFWWIATAIRSHRGKKHSRQHTSNRRTAQGSFHVNIVHYFSLLCLVAWKPARTRAGSIKPPPRLCRTTRKLMTITQAACRPHNNSNQHKLYITVKLVRARESVRVALLFVCKINAGTLNSSSFPRRSAIC